MYLGQHQDRASRPSPAKNSTPTDQPHAEKAGMAVVFSRQLGTTRSRRLAGRSCCRGATFSLT